MVKLREWKVRGPPAKDTENHTNLTRVQLSPEAMKDLKLEPNKVCIISKADNPEVEYESIAWKVPSSQSINNDVAIFYDTNRKRCGFDLSDRICISAGGLPPLAESVCLRDISHELPDRLEAIDEAARKPWEWIVWRGCLSELFMSWIIINKALYIQNYP